MQLGVPRIRETNGLYVRYSRIRATKLLELMNAYNEPLSSLLEALREL